jgi:uncharacterized protein YjbK
MDRVGHEIEMKWRLDGGQAARLAELLSGRLGPPCRLLQDNRFYDTADGALRRTGCALRLRQENGRLQMTCKRRLAEATSGLHRQEEIERWLNPVLLPAIDRGEVAPEDCLPLPAAHRRLLKRPLCLLGRFTNDRRVYRDGDDLLCLDRTSFANGRTDHELELETPTPDASVPRWTTLLAAWRITTTPQDQTKLQRMFEPA